jgi:S1-C subfamily serine protease
MDDIEKANGHRASGVLPVLKQPPLPGPRPKPEECLFDLETSVSAVRSLRSSVPAESHTAASLGTEREGNAVLIDDKGLLLTIGYLVVEATEIYIGDAKGHPVPGQLVGYDHETGFGLVRAAHDLGVSPIMVAESAEDLRTDDPVIIAAQGGIEQAMSGHVADRREFAGSWEYMLDLAIFTVPLHPTWSGAALIDIEHGKLVGVGSLFVQEAGAGGAPVSGNMFVPIDLLTPIFDDLLRSGRRADAPRPWLGMHTTEALGHLLVAGIHDGGPADEAGIMPGDLVLGVDGVSVETLAEMYRAVWSLGRAGVEVPFAIQRGPQMHEIVVISSDRRIYIALPQRH